MPVLDNLHYPKYFYGNVEMVNEIKIFTVYCRNYILDSSI